MPPHDTLPDLRHFMEKRVRVKLIGGRSVSGVLKAVNEHLNIVLYDAVDETRNLHASAGEEAAEEPKAIGTSIIGGRAIVDIESAEV